MKTKLLTILFLFCLIRLIPAQEEEEEEKKGSSEDKKDEVGTVIGIDLGTTYSW